MLVSVKCKPAGHGPYYTPVGEWVHSLVKVAKLQCKTASHGPCLFWWGVGNTVWLMLQSYSVKLLARVLVYFGGRQAGNHSHIWSKTVLSAERTFKTLITRPCPTGRAIMTVQRQDIPRYIIFGQVSGPFIDTIAS